MKSKSHFEYLRSQGKSRFDQVRSTWIECGRWAMPWRIKWLLSQTPGERNNYHIVDTTHILALRSYVAGFLEGNTSASRQWARIRSKDLEKNQNPNNRDWLDTFTTSCMNVLSTSNFYNSAGIFYSDFGVFNTGAHYIEQLKDGLFFHNLIPGSYYTISNALDESVVLIREYCLSVKAIVEEYGIKTKSGKYDWSNISDRVHTMYDNCNYTQLIDVVQIVQENEDFDPTQPVAGENRQWLEVTYELGGSRGQYYQDGQEFGTSAVDPEGREKDIYLRKTYSRTKPFIVGRSAHNGNFEYGEDGPTLQSLGLIKSLNKKAIGKDQALEQMLRPAVQGPANLRKSYITTAPNSYVPLDPTSLQKGGLQVINPLSPAISTLNADVQDLRSMVDKFYYADYLLYLSRNPKTRTATETNAIVQEQQLIIGPNLQSLNRTYNLPVLEFVMDWVLYNDPYLPPIPKDLGGDFLRIDFVSVFAQAQRAADLPSIDRYVAMIEQVGQLNPKIWDKANVDKLADLYEDRLYLPVGLNNPQDKVDAMRQQAALQAQRQQALHETIPAIAGAAKDIGLKAE